MYDEITLVESKDGDSCIYCDEGIEDDTVVSFYQRNFTLSKSHVFELKKLIEWVNTHQHRQIISKLDSYPRINYGIAESPKTCPVCQDFIRGKNPSLTVYSSSFRTYLRIHSGCLENVADDLRECILDNADTFFTQQAKDGSLFD